MKRQKKSELKISIEGEKRADILVAPLLVANDERAAIMTQIRKGGKNTRWIAQKDMITTGVEKEKSCRFEITKNYHFNSKKDS